METWEREVGSRYTKKCAGSSLKAGSALLKEPCLSQNKHEACLENTATGRSTWIV